MSASRTLSALSIVLLFSLTGVVSGGSSPADAHGSLKLRSDLASLNAAELSDLDAWANQNGSDLETAIESFAGQREFMALANRVEEEFEREFAHAAWVPGDQPHGVIFVVGVPSAQLSELVDATTVRVLVEGGLALSSSEFTAGVEALYTSISKVAGAANVALTGYPERSEVELFIAQTSETNLLEVRSSAEPLEQLGVGVKVSIVSFDEETGLEGVLGGRQWGQCTAAFSVKRGSIYGMTTANHCTSVGLSMAYQGTAMSGPTAPVSLSSSSGDIKWRRTVSTVAEPRFQATHGGYRLVTSTLNPVAGTAICKYGRVTGQTCSTVVSTTVCANGYCGLSRVSSDISEPGDSGGPWFYGNTAMGVHHGTAQSSLFGVASAFTRIGAVNLLNLVVLTG